MTVWAGLIALGLGLGASLFLPVPQNLKTSFDAGQSLYALGEFEGAIIEYSKIVKFDSKAVRTDSVRVVFGNDLELPVVAAAWYQLGNAYKKSGQHEEAVEAYRQVLDVGSVAEDFKSLVQFQVAETRFFAKEYGEATKEYKRYVELFPETREAGKAYFYAGWSEFNSKEYDQSIETLNGMLAVYPQDRYAPDSQYRIASAFYEKGEYAKSVEMAQITLDQYPNSPVIAQALYLQARAYDQMGRDEEAIKAYRDVRNLYDRMFELLRGSFREGKNVDFENYRELFETSSLRVAEIFRKTDQFEEAYQELIAAQETAEERFYKAKVQMRIGDNYMEWEKFDEAWTAYNQVIELYGDTPYPPNAQYQKGESKYFAGDYAAAREDYLQLLLDYPDSETGLRSAALYSAGWSAEKLGATDQAIASYTQAVDNFGALSKASRPLAVLAVRKATQGKGGKHDETTRLSHAVGDGDGRGAAVHGHRTGRDRIARRAPTRSRDSGAATAGLPVLHGLAGMDGGGRGRADGALVLLSRSRGQPVPVRRERGEARECQSGAQLAVAQGKAPGADAPDDREGGMSYVKGTTELDKLLMEHHRLTDLSGTLTQLDNDLASAWPYVAADFPENVEAALTDFGGTVQGAHRRDRRNAGMAGRRAGRKLAAPRGRMVSNPSVPMGGRNAVPRPHGKGDA